jgi:hypothetical protein
MSRLRLSWNNCARRVYTGAWQELDIVLSLSSSAFSKRLEAYDTRIRINADAWPFLGLGFIVYGAIGR